MLRSLDYGPDGVYTPKQFGNATAFPVPENESYTGIDRCTYIFTHVLQGLLSNQAIPQNDAEEVIRRAARLTDLAILELSENS